MVGGIGQSSPEVLAQGSFAAPDTAGDYTFTLTNVLANVVTELNTPPAFSPVVQAMIDATAGSFTIMVDAGIPGDLDGDGDVDLSDLAELLGSYGDCEGDPGYNPSADLNGNGCVELSDLAELLGNYGYGT